MSGIEEPSARQARPVQPARVVAHADPTLRGVARRDAGRHVQVAAYDSSTSPVCRQVAGVARHLGLNAVAVQEGLVDEDDPIYGE